MAINDANKIDAISIDKVTKECVLTIIDHLNWTTDTAHLSILEDKLNAYFAFIDSDELLETYPPAKNKKLRIDYVFKYKPSNEIILNSMADQIKLKGFNFKSEHLNVNEYSPTDTQEI